MGTMLDRINEYVARRERLESKKDEMREMERNGYTRAQIADKLEVPESTIRYVLG